MSIRTAIQRMRSDIHSAYKSEDTEEFFDRIFTKPLGYLWARLFMRLGWTPNMVTLLSMGIGFVGGLLFYPERFSVNLIGVLLVVWANILDSTDGQLARLTGNKSTIGRILDALSTSVWYVAIYAALALRLMDDPIPFAGGRVCREVCTERDHFNAGGVYYELPAENAHGFAGLRPVATHNRPICDYASWRGLFALSLPGEVRLMAIDDFWKAGKARGFGGPWKDTAVAAGEASDAYLMNGFDRKTLTLAADAATTVTMEVDVTGWGVWVKAGEYAIGAGAPVTDALPRAFGGYWVRFRSSAACTATAQFVYE